MAVSRLQPSRGLDKGEGALLTERLTTALVRTGRIQAVERSLLPKLMEERSLARTGALETDATEGARLARVDGIVMGTYNASGKVVRLVVRVVDYRTGVIVGAAEAELEREGESVLSDLVPYEASAPLLRCSDAEARVNALEESILDIKARYWARRLKDGLPASDLAVNPAATIPDPTLKARFYKNVRRWYNADRLPRLTPAEVALFVKADGEAYSLHQECRL